MAQSPRPLMVKITLELSLPETNLILEALGARPYAQVYELVDTIHRQASAQIDADGDAPVKRMADARVSGTGGVA